MKARIVAHCRAGFEAEVGADLANAAAAAGTAVDLDVVVGRAFVVAAPRAFDAQRWPRALAEAPPVFIRSLFFGTGPHTLFDPSLATGRPDRIAPLVGLVDAFRREFPLPGLPRTMRGSARFAELRLETPDTNEGKSLSTLARALEVPLARALADSGALAERGDATAPPTLPALHILFVDGAHVFVGASMLPWGSRWTMGIPRLRMPRAAPSRSTLKLAEAIVAFLGEREGELMRAGMRAVDLGAAPGGWTWQLAHRGLMVTAVDNGALKGEIADDPHVRHLRADGLTWLPRKPVDWVTCDIAEKPARVAALVGRWLAAGYARRSIFNLKLPMKKRYDEVRRCEAIISQALLRSRGKYRMVLRQLYHDREEITGYVERVAP